MTSDPMRALEIHNKAAQVHINKDIEVTIDIISPTITLKFLDKEN